MTASDLCRVLDDLAELGVQTQVVTHLGDEPDEDDRRDMRRLAERFGLTPPPPYDETRSRA
jgi:hypothetical protein